MVISSCTSYVMARVLGRPVVANDTPHDLICDNGAACLGWCWKPGSRASSLVTRALTVALLELRWGKSVCSLIS